jgi:pilus assembly protein CpaE
MPARPDIEDEYAAGFHAEDEFELTHQAPEALSGGLGAASDPYAAADAYEPAGAFPRPSDDYEPAPAMANPVAEMQASAEAALNQWSLPRISVHVFCQQASTAALVDRTSRDRRLARASTLVRPGGLAAAVEYYQNEPTPSLVVVECAEPREVMLGLLDHLAEVCDPGTKVIVIGAANDIALYRELMRKGVSEYLTPPLQPLQLISAITTLYSDPTAPFTGRQVAFVGVKGGAGASTIAHNFAFALSERMQTQTVMVDFDLPFGTAGLDFNQDPLQGVANALGQPDRLDPVLLERMMVRCNERLSLFAAPASLDEDYEFPTEAFEEVIGKIRSTAPFVVLDLPHLWSGWMRRVLMSSDEVVMVATPDLASLRNGKNLIDLLRAHRPNDAPPRLVLNQVAAPGRPEIPVKDFGEALGVTPALVLPFDPKLFGKAANNGQMIAEVGPKTKAAEGIDFLAQLISRREPVRVAKRAGLASLFRR